MRAFHENHIRARKLARSPGHYAALVAVFCEIDRIAARAMPVPSSYYGSEQPIHEYAAAARLGDRQMKPCNWKQEDSDCDTYGTDCGHYFSVTDGTPEENGFRFCVYCGRPLEQHLYEEDEE